MAQNMQELARRMKSIESTEHITNAMRLVSASKYKKAKNTFDRTSMQLDAVCGTMREIIAAAESAKDESGKITEGYVRKQSGKCESSSVGGENCGNSGNRNIGKLIMVVITSNKGLCGGFNANLLKTAVEQIRDIPKEDVEIFAIGSKGKDFFAHNEYTIMGEYGESAEKLTFADAEKIAQPIIEKFESGDAAEVLLVYTKYVNSLKQEPAVKRLMPMDESELAADGKLIGDMRTELEFSPSAEAVLDYMLPKYFELALFEAIIESAACEHAARRTAMENATDNANEMLEKLSLTYNRARQTAITNEIIEIISGAEQ